MRGWLELFRALGESLVEVLRAEVAALRADYQSSAKQLARALALAAVAGAFGFWAVGALCILLFELLARIPGISRWGAAGILVLGLGSAMAIVGFLAWRTLRQIEGPGSTAQRRLEDHLSWWRARVFEAGRTLPPADEPEETP